MRRVVVTGIGATTPLGGDVASSWANLLAGKSGISTLEQEWVERFELPVTFAGQAKVPASEVLSPQEAKRLDPLLPVPQHIRDSDVQGEYDVPRPQALAVAHPPVGSGTV